MRPLTKNQLTKLLNSASRNVGMERGIASAHIKAGGAYEDLPKRLRTTRTDDIFSMFGDYFGTGATP